jgi:putative phage-type endonuclease
MQAIVIPCKDRAAWLEARKKGLGGSDIAAVAGISPFAGPITVWQAKLGLTIPAESEAMAWGSALEQPIADRYAKDHPDVQLSEPGLLRDPDCPWMLATPDRIVGDGVKPVRGLELKTAGSVMSARWGDPPDGEIPDEYYAQIQWYMRVTRLTEWDLAVLIGGQDYREYRVAYDQEHARDLEDAGAEFWKQYILTGDVPPMDATEGAKKYIEQRYPAEQIGRGMRRANGEAEDLFHDLLKARDNEKLATSQKKVLENRLKVLIGEHEGMDLVRGGKLLWKRGKGREQVDWQSVAQQIEPDGARLSRVASEHTTTKSGSRTFRVTAPKE